MKNISDLWQSVVHLWKHYYKYIITLEKRVCFLLSFDSVRTTTHHHVFLKKVQVRRLVIISRPPILIQCDDHMRICQFSGTHCTAAGWRTTYAHSAIHGAAAAFSLVCFVARTHHNAHSGPFSIEFVQYESFD